MLSDDAGKVIFNLAQQDIAGAAGDGEVRLRDRQPGDPHRRGCAVLPVRCLAGRRLDAEPAPERIGGAAENEATFDPRPLIARADWRHARSMPRFPHWYFVQPREDTEDFFAFVALINCEGEPRLFGKTRYRYLQVGEHVYWLSRSLYDRDALVINRRLAEDDQGARFDGSNYT